MVKYTYVTEARQLEEVANAIAASDVVGVDTETTGLDPHTAKIRLLQIGTGDKIYVIDLFKTGTMGPVKEALASEKVIKILQNAKFDQKFLKHHYDLELWPLFDTFRASNLIYNGKFDHKHDLYSLYNRELGDFNHSKDQGASDWRGELSQDQLDYAAEDVSMLHDLRDVLKKKLTANSLNKVALIEFGAIMPESAMELNGFYLDPEMWLTLANDNKKKKFQLEKYLHQHLPSPHKQISLFDTETDFNLESPKQMLDSLKQMGMSDLEGTKEIHLAMKAKEYPIILKILEYREYAQAVKTFGDEYLRWTHPITGRIHTSFYPFTGAGRYASSNPNLQNLPRKKEYRACWRPRSGYKFVIYDYSQIELRGAAEIAEDENLIHIYATGLDAHKRTASMVTGLPESEITKAHRQLAKAVNFGFIFGMSASKFVLYAQSGYQVSLTEKEAKIFRDKYFEAYPGIAAWHRRIFADDYRKQGSTRTLSNRIRYLSSDAYNEWANTPVQGTAADGLKKALYLAYKAFKKYKADEVRLVHMVHDEIIAEVKDEPDLLASASQDLKQAMEDGMQPLLTRVPAVAEGGIASSWAEKS